MLHTCILTKTDSALYEYDYKVYFIGEDGSQLRNKIKIAFYA